MPAFVVAGGGFLLAVLWFDLMFDVQARGHARGRVPGDVLTSISRYYRRVTIDAFPMNRLVALVMAVTVAAVVVEIAQGDDPTWLGWVSLGLVGLPVGIAGGRTVRNAQRLGRADDPPEGRSILARKILRDHVLCFASIAMLVAVQLAAG